jgi:hypothetical protein
MKSTHQSQHTPGPWNCVEKGYKGLAAGIVRDKYNDPVADCRYSEIASRDAKSPETIDANARLIAAAPEMYEALKRLYPLAWKGDISISPSKPEDPALKFAREAITKAEGKE